MPGLRNLAGNARGRKADPTYRGHRAWNTITHLLRNDRGAVTAPFTVLVPFFIFLMVFFADVSVLYLTHTEMFNAAREISRRMATGQLQDEPDVQAYAARKLFLGQRSYYVDADFTGGKRVTIAIDLQGATFFGFFLKPLVGRYLVATASAGNEPNME